MKPGSNPGCLGPLLELLTSTLGSLALGLGGCSWPQETPLSPGHIPAFPADAKPVVWPVLALPPSLQGPPPAQGLSGTPLPRQRHPPSFLCMFLPAWMPALLPHLALSSSIASQAPHVGGAYQLGTPCVRCFVCEASFFVFSLWILK